MTLGFSAEQNELRRVARKFFEAKSPENEVRRLMATEAGYDPVLWAQMADELGLQGLALPEAYGGQGFGFVELAIVLEEMGRVLLCAPFFSSAVLASSAVLHSEDDEAKQTLLPVIASGKVIATLAYTEASGSWSPAETSATAAYDGTRWCIDATKMFVPDGHTAGTLIVSARTVAGLSLFVVDATDPAVKRELLPTMDQSRKQAKIVLDAAPAKLLGREGAAEAVLARVLDLAAVALAAEQVGGAQRVLEMSVAYAKDRVQFGRPIGSFQAIKHKCAEMFVEVESAKSAAYYAARVAATLDDELPLVASLAKAFCSDTYSRAAADNIQIHGGIGFTWEHSAHLYFKRAKSSEILFGDPVYHRELLAGRLNI